MSKSSRLVSELVNSLENNIIRCLWAGAAGHIPAFLTLCLCQIVLAKNLFTFYWTLCI